MLEDITTNEIKGGVMIEELTKLKKQNIKLKKEVKDLKNLLVRYEERFDYHKNSCFDNDNKIKTLEWIVSNQKDQMVKFMKQIDELTGNRML